MTFYYVRRAKYRTSGEWECPGAFDLGLGDNACKHREDRSGGGEDLPGCLMQRPGFVCPEPKYPFKIGTRFSGRGWGSKGATRRTSKTCTAAEAS